MDLSDVNMDLDLEYIIKLCEELKVTKKDNNDVDKNTNQESVLLTNINKETNCNLNDELDKSNNNLINKLDKKKQKKSRSDRCYVCSIKLPLCSQFKCKCDNYFCTKHRHIELHNCSYDGKTEHIANLKKMNPLVVATKVDKI